MGWRRIMTASNAMRPTRHCSALAFGAKLLVASAVTLPMVGCKTHGRSDASRRLDADRCVAAPSDPGVAGADDASHPHPARLERPVACAARPAAQLRRPLSSDRCRQQPPRRRRRRAAAPTRSRRCTPSARSARCCTDQGFGRVVDLGRGLQRRRAPRIRRSASPTCATWPSRRSAATGRPTSPTTR